MVLPLIAGLLGIGAVGAVSALALSQIVYWASLGATAVVAFRELRYLLNERPFDLVEGETANNIIYLMITAGTSAIVFKLVNSVFVVYGSTMALFLAVFFVAGYLLGFRRVVSFLSFTAKEFRGVFNASRR